MLVIAVLVFEQPQPTEGLPAYAALFVLAVPFALAGPLKIVGLYWMGTGHPVLGLAALVFAYAASFIVVERIYKAGRPKLLTIRWFAAVVKFGAGLKDSALAYLRATSIWTAAMALKAQVKAGAKDVLNRMLRRGGQPERRLP